MLYNFEMIQKQKQEQVKKKPQEQLNAQIDQVQEQYSCCDAKLFKIPEGKKWLFTFCLINIPALLHEILHLQWFSHNHYFGALYVLFLSHLLNLWTFMNLCLQDPGFIQKIKYGYEIDEEFVPIPKSQHINNYVVISYVVPTRQMTTRLKFCTTCNIFRPHRASHCNECGVCVERMDHHCPWIGTCVGKRNQKYFYVFLLSLMIMIITTVVMCVMIMVGTEEDPDGFGDRVKIYPLTVVFIILPCLPGLIFVGIMLGFHSYLLATDMTTKQVIDEKWAPIIGNPQRKNYCFKNIIKTLLKSQQSKSQYKHKAFTYYNNEAESSNTGNQKNSKNSDPESASKKKQNEKQMNYSSSQESIHKHPAEKPNIEEKMEVEEVETQQKLQV